ncbi:hypothetical protein [Bdellovibrio sp. HCB209]|uniref:hypothetical protein n=1 Tax=Bdellovibrio sp. HCB209 TaxID=3394354 RepID=UPI0039B5017B
MKTLILTLLLLTTATTAQANSSYKKFATCKSQDQTITAYSAGTFRGQLVVSQGDDETLYKDVYESDDNGKRTFNANNGIAVTIDINSGKGVLYISNASYPMNCEIAKNAAKPPQPVQHGRVSCQALPEGYDPLEGPELCPQEKVWAKGATGLYMCCEHPPV